MMIQVGVMNVGVDSNKSNEVKTTESTSIKSFVNWMSFFLYWLLFGRIHFIMSERSFVDIGPKYLASIYQLRKMSMEKR